MDRLVESVPNISEGRDKAVLSRLVEGLQATPNLVLLDLHVDPDHHRSVLTLVGEPEAMATALFDLIRKAQQLIDLRRHQGKHPRIGAVDVVPWIPFRGITMEECVGYARSLGAQVGQELNIPVFLYEGASRVSSRARLETIRRGGLSALETRIKTDALWKPDFGPSVLHQTAGAIAIGARFFLVAFNVVLNSNDVAMAHQIAKVIRTSGGGLPSLKAMGVSMPSRSLVQVSMNLTDFRETSLRAAFHAVEEQAHSLGVEILESELVGLVPQAAWDEDLPRDLKIQNGNPDRVIERRLNQHPLFHHGSLR